MKVGFVKYLCNGNDYLLLDCRNAPVPPRATLEAMCRREVGIGARGVVAVVSEAGCGERPASRGHKAASTLAGPFSAPAEAEAGVVLRLRCFDTGGVEVRPSGDDLLCGARFAADLGAVKSGRWLKFSTLAGEMEALVAEEGVAGCGERPASRGLTSAELPPSADRHLASRDEPASVGELALLGSTLAGPFSAPAGAGAVTLRLPDVAGAYSLGNFVFMNLVTPQYVELTRDLVPIDPVALAGQINRSESFETLGGASVNFVQVPWAAAEEADDGPAQDHAYHAMWDDGAGADEEPYAPYSYGTLPEMDDRADGSADAAQSPNNTIQSMWGYPAEAIPAISLELGVRDPAPGYATGAAAVAIALQVAQGGAQEAVAADEPLAADSGRLWERSAHPGLRPVLRKRSPTVPTTGLAASTSLSIEIAYPGGIYTVSATPGSDGSFTRIEVFASVIRLFEGTT